MNVLYENGRSDGNVERTGEMGSTLRGRTMRYLSLTFLILAASSGLASAGYLSDLREPRFFRFEQDLQLPANRSFREVTVERTFQHLNSESGDWTGCIITVEKVPAQSQPSFPKNRQVLLEKHESMDTVVILDPKTNSVLGLIDCVRRNLKTAKVTQMGGLEIFSILEQLLGLKLEVRKYNMYLESTPSENDSGLDEA